MDKLPSLFVSHGSPMLAIEESPAQQFLLALGEMLPRPKTILVVSAHWESLPAFKVSFASRPETIHDFSGFPDPLFDITYDPPGAPDMAMRVEHLLERAGIKVESSSERGLDHGAWVPLSLMYPNADIPVTQISILRGGSTADHEKMGQALASLRGEGVLIIGSGSLTHNLQEFQSQSIRAPVPDWVSSFADWMEKALKENRHEDLLDYRRRAPYAARNHPTEEHILPLFVAMGAAGNRSVAERLHASVEYGALAMDVYAFSEV